MQEVSIVESVNAVINRELTDKTAAALLATTFKGLDATNMKKALMEGMIRGFTFQDFLQKNVYAIPFSSGYSLITSIDFARKLGMKSGVVGVEAPIYTEKEGKIETCTVTVKRKVGDYVGEYTATVYFDEYNTKKNQWLSKPRTMIAKVAEMHALRKACPEELSQQYVEEEMHDDPSRIKQATVLVEESGLQMKNFKKDGDSKEEESAEKDKMEGSPNTEHQTGGGGQG